MSYISLCKDINNRIIFAGNKYEETTCIVPSYNANKLLKYTFDNVYQVRILYNNSHSNIWFYGPDIANILGYGLSSYMYLTLEDYEKRSIYPTNTPQDNRSIVLVSLTGVFKLIHASKRTRSFKFQDWILYNLLPMLYRY